MDYSKFTNQEIEDLLDATCVIFRIMNSYYSSSDEKLEAFCTDEAYHGISQMLTALFRQERDRCIFYHPVDVEATDVS